MKVENERRFILKEIKKKTIISRIIAGIVIVPFTLTFVFTSYFTWNKVPIWFTVIQFLVVIYLSYILHRIFFTDKNGIKMIERQVKKEMREDRIFEQFNNFLKSEQNREKLFQLKDFKNFRKDSLSTKKERVMIRSFVIVFSIVFSILSVEVTGKESYFWIAVFFVYIGLKVIFSKNPPEKAIRDEYIEILKLEARNGKYPDIDFE